MTDDSIGKFWEGIFCADAPADAKPPVLFDPDARAGLWPFVLPADHFLTLGARFHDPFYQARPHPGPKAEGDVRTFKIWALDALSELEDELEVEVITGAGRDVTDPLWEKMADRLDWVVFAWAMIRGPIGIAAWHT